MTDGMLKIMAGAAMMGAVIGGTAWMSMGPKQAEVTTQAMAVIQSLTQTSGSVAARNLMNGGSGHDHVDAHLLVQEGYLAALPENPAIRSRDGLPRVSATMSADGVMRPVVQMMLGDAGELCDEIQQQVTGRKAEATDRYPLDRVGCVKASGGFVAYSRI